MDAFAFTGRTWKIGGKHLPPTENDVQKVLDEAAKTLYAKKTGSTFTMGGLHIEKTGSGHDVYVHVGTYT
jgi:hypothetical protein